MKKMSIMKLKINRKPRPLSKMSQAVNPYGDGQASERIVQHIKYYFNLTNDRPNHFEFTKDL